MTATVAAVALLWGATAGMAIMILAGVVGAFVALPAGAARYVTPGAVVVGLAVALYILWYARAAWSLERVALWIEERAPELRYALVTAIDPRYSATVGAERGPLLDAISDVRFEPLVGHAVRRTFAWALGACALAVAVLGILRPELSGRVRGVIPGAHGAGAPAPIPNRLVPLRAVLQPPAYTQLRSTTLEEPTNVEALIGSRITFRGNGTPDGVTGVHGKDTLAASADGKGWALSLTMPADPASLHFHDRSYSRIVVLAPVTDSAPKVRLILPANDTTYRHPPRGRLSIEARATDDYGLDHGYFDFMISEGSEESFDTRQVIGARINFGNALNGTMRTVIDFDTLKLGPGHVVHIRAVAFDRNNVTGPGRGVSETRTLRVASTQEYDSVSITPAKPLPIDTMYMHQRVLNMRTDTLIRRKARLDRKEYVNTSTRYSAIQETIRQRVERVIAILEDDGVGGRFETHASKLLRQAADQMWEARALLGVGEPENAYPYMKRALQLLDEARKAQRYYLRGLLPPNVVNIERVRMQGEDTAAAIARKGRDRIPDPRAALRERVVRAASVYAQDASAGLDSLLMIRVSALRAAPPVAAALQEAIDALQGGAQLDVALNRARRLLEPPTHRMTSPAAWAGGGVP
jgi:hypothetical protein